MSSLILDNKDRSQRKKRQCIHVLYITELQWTSLFGHCIGEIFLFSFINSIKKPEQYYVNTNLELVQQYLTDCSSFQEAT